MPTPFSYFLANELTCSCHGDFALRYSCKSEYKPLFCTNHIHEKVPSMQNIKLFRITMCNFLDYATTVPSHIPPSPECMRCPTPFPYECRLKCNYIMLLISSCSLFLSVEWTSPLSKVIDPYAKYNYKTDVKDAMCIPRPPEHSPEKQKPGCDLSEILGMPLTTKECLAISRQDFRWASLQSPFIVLHCTMEIRPD